MILELSSIGSCFALPEDKLARVARAAPSVALMVGLQAYAQSGTILATPIDVSAVDFLGSLPARYIALVTL